MQEEKSPAQIALKEANDKASQICFEIGRLHWQIKLHKEEAEDLNRKFSNLEIDLKKATDEYKRAQKSAHAEYQAKTKAASRLSEVPPPPAMDKDGVEYVPCTTEECLAAEAIPHPDALHNAYNGSV
jgi:predicted  nucleic acid-binding Zn-ribbon protein